MHKITLEREDGSCTQLLEIESHVKVHHGPKSYITEVLKDVPDDMELMVVEKHRRKPLEIKQSWITPGGKIVIEYKDGSKVKLRNAHAKPPCFGIKYEEHDPSCQECPVGNQCKKESL